MAKIVAKLFRDPRNATQALSELKKKGFKEEEISFLARPNGHTGHKVSFPGTGEMVVHGPIQAAITEAEAKPEKPALATTLGLILGLPEDAAGYFAFGVSMGAILVTVNATDEKGEAAAQDILRASSPSTHVAMETVDHSPGFKTAGRMNATDPVDAPMSGDFRKY